MAQSSIIETIKAIEVESPVDKIIRQLKQLMSEGHLKPGDRLPAERILAEKFAVGRTYVRDAIRKLEFYGLLKTSPQSGTYVAHYNIQMMEGILNDIINFNKDDFSALIEARYYMEINAARLAAQRRTDEDLDALKAAVDAYDAKIKREGECSAGRHVHSPQDRQCRQELRDGIHAAVVAAGYHPQYHREEDLRRLSQQ